jgi:hypothetical protein
VRRCSASSGEFELTDYALLKLEERSGHRAKVIVPASHVFDVEAV